jgi:HK97 family phage major capsid protein
MTTLFNLKEQLGMVSNELISADDELNKLASNPSAAMDDVEGAQKRRDDIQKRFDILKGQHDEAEKRQKDAAKIEVVQSDPQASLIHAKAEFYRATAKGETVPTDVMNQLTAIGSSTTGGEKLIPSNMLGSIITEPTPVNNLRGVWTSSSVTGLEVPKMGFSISDTNLRAVIDDNTNAKDVTVTGDNISFGRYKTKIRAQVSDTVLHAADASLVSTIETKFRDLLAYKEVMCAFGAPADLSTAGDIEHMSFYNEDSSSEYLIGEVEGATLRQAVVNSIYTLHPFFRSNVKVAMSGLKYAEMLDSLVNSNATYFAATPEQVLGAPMVEIPLATVPVVGDFTQVHINYDPTITYDTDKDVRTGNYSFVLTVWFDIHRYLDTAFKLAVEEESSS